MSDNGYVLAYRRVWSHPIFRDLLDAAIWNYLYQNAAWRDCRIISHGTKVDLKRGQIFISSRQLAAGFCCAEARIRRLINALTDDAMITTLATHRGTLLTICNYKDYQPFSEAADALNSVPDTHQSRATDAPLIKKNERKEEKEIKRPSVAAVPSGVEPNLWGAFKEFRRGIKHPVTPVVQESITKELCKLAADGHDPNAVLEQSIRNGWRGVFAIKDGGKARHQPPPAKKTNVRTL